MENFILLAAGLDSNSQLRLSLPAAKLFQPYAIKGGEPELKVKEVIMSAVNQSRCQTFHREPFIGGYSFPRSFQHILANLSFPLSQGPVVLPLDCATEAGLKSCYGANKSTSEVLRERTMFSHSECQKCYEWVPTEIGLAAWVGAKETFSAKIPSMKIAGPASMMNMGQVYTCTALGCVVHCACRLCRDQSKLCRLQCKAEVCTDCSIQCNQHYVKLPRLFNVDTDHFTIITKTIGKLQFAHPYAGIPLACNLCTTDVSEHQALHLTFHMSCKFCKYAVRPFMVSKHAVSMADYEDAVSTINWVDRKTCSECLVKLSDQYDRKKHEETVHYGKEKPYKCESCDKTYANSNALEYHKRVTHESDGQKSTCDVCGAQFSSETNMLRHYNNIHKENTDKSKNECDSCGKIFARKDHLYRHKRDQHNEITRENLSYVGDLNTLHVNKCGKCDKVLRRASDLKRHLQMVHGDSKHKQEHKCIKCEKTFGWKKSLERHVKTMHSDP
jgi:uncharacterized C2H2 Zn-finger protein